MADALATLSDAFDDASRRPGEKDNARRVAVVSWPTVPFEIVRAAGLCPLAIRGGAAPTPLADGWLEPDVFPNRLRQLVDAFLARRLHHAACVILPRTSDSDYKAFLYLRELIRRGIAPSGPPILLFDLLQSNGPDVSAYDAGRTCELFETLAAITGGRPSIDDVRGAIVQTNAARAAMRRLLALRRGPVRVKGAEVMPLLGASWSLPPEEYAALANTAADVLSRRLALDGPRVLLAGAPIDGPALTASIEALGALVVAEVGPWGSDAAGEDVSLDIDPFAAIAERYRRNAIGPRTPVAAVQQRVRRMAGDVDAVVVLLPPEDTVFGWDYPALRAWLDAQALPHVSVTVDPCQPFGAAERDRLRRFIAALTPRVEARHG
jgi:hypothetical protein